MADIYKSKYTGERIEELLEKIADTSPVVANDGTETFEELNTVRIDDVNYKIPKTDVVANPIEGSSDIELTKLKVDGLIYDIPKGTEVSANPDESSTLTLEKLKIGETVYNVPKPEEGADVEANPTETPTEELTSLKVGETVYSIPEGGGTKYLHTASIIKSHSTTTATIVTIMLLLETDIALTSVSDVINAAINAGYTNKYLSCNGVLSALAVDISGASDSEFVPVVAAYFTGEAIRVFFIDTLNTNEELYFDFGSASGAMNVVDFIQSI